MKIAWLLPALLLAAFTGVVHAAETEVRARATAPLFDDPVVARGRGVEIKASEVEDAVIGLKATLATQGQTISESQRPAIEAQVLDRIILTRILQLKAPAADLATAKEMADKFVADTKGRAPSEASYRRQLMAVGIKPEIFEARALEQAIVETVIKREIRDGVKIRDDEVREFHEQGVDVSVREFRETLARLEKEGGTQTALYSDAQQRLDALTKANLASLERPDTVRAEVVVVYTVDRSSLQELPADILAGKRAKIDKARTRIQAGEEFAVVAREMSEDPDVAKNHGAYATTREAVTLPELRQALFSLPIGEVSEVLTTKVGYYLVKVREREPAGKIPLDKAREDIRVLLLNQEVEKRLPAYLTALKQEYGIERLTAAEMK
ncbi:MAG: peptidylprolyl isomerase [Limisphaerales bacterium]